MKCSVRTLAALALLIGIATRPAEAGVIFTPNFTPTDFVTEYLMESQGEDAVFVKTMFGTDPHSPLHFSSFVDPTAMTFSFSLVPGSTYKGLSMTLTGSGAFDSSSNTWIISSSGMLGSTSWSTLGTDVITSDTMTDQGEKSNRDRIDEHGNKIGDIHDIVFIDKENPIRDFGTAILTDKDGKEIGKPFPIRTIRRRTGAWNWEADGPDFTVTSVGFTGPDGGTRSFTTTIAPVPEPSTLTLLTLGTVGLIGYRWRRRKHAAA
jgi:hypothetical protein